MERGLKRFSFIPLLVILVMLIGSVAWSLTAARVAFAAETDDIIIYDEVMRGGIQVKKELPLGKAQGDSKVEGTQFTIALKEGEPVYVNGDDGERFYAVGETIFTLTCDADGNAATGDEVLPYGTYLVTESRVNKGQKGDGWTDTVVVHEDKKIVKAKTDVNEMTKLSLYVEKRDSERGMEQGDTTLEGIEYTVYNRSAAPIQYLKNGTKKTIPVDGVVDTMVTDEKGRASLPEGSLDYGTYEVVETNPHPDITGYLPQNPVWSSKNVPLHEPGVMDMVKAGTNNNDPIRGGVKVIKYDKPTDKPKPQGDGDLAAVYAVYNRSAEPVMIGGIEYPVDSVVLELNADPKTGVASSAADALPYGTYEVKEIKPPTGYLLDTKWNYKFSVRADGHIYSPAEADENKNDPIMGGIKVYKKDFDTDTSDAQGNGNFDGIEVSIYNASANSILYKGKEIAKGALVDTIILNDGYGATGEAVLPYGTYKLRETKVPEGTGYTLNELWNPTVVIHEAGWAVLVEE